MFDREVMAALRRRVVDGGVPALAQEAFERMVQRYAGGESGGVPWDEIAPAGAGDLVPLEELGSAARTAAGEQALGRLVWIVLNGGLGTSMRMERAKSLLPVKGSQTFLDLIAQHVLGLRRRFGVPLPVLFMNSFATREDTLARLAPHSLEIGDLPLEFVQHRFPRLLATSGLPYGEAGQREAWAPPGHGDLYLALRSSGLLKRLLTAGVRWAFVSNADNLGASPHPGILGGIAERGIDFVMEVTKKTAADIKGGTLVRRGGRLQLLEIAQVPPDRRAAFQDLGVFPVFNTNNLWVDLKALAERQERGALDLPLIVNRKEVSGVPVVQLETAMGAAIGTFDRAAGVLVPRARFAPVKTTDDLVVRRSDAFVRGEESPLVPNPARDPELGPPVVSLDARYYQAVPELDRRIPHPLGLLHARSLVVEGDVRFGRNVSVCGDARVVVHSGESGAVPDGASLQGEVEV